MVLIEDWCQQYPSHSIGALEHGPGGEIYVSGGDGASFNFTDWGQDGNPVNPCGDPHTGGSPTPPSAEGGALRSQDLRTGGDPVSLDGTIIRVRPTGDAWRDEPDVRQPGPNTRRIVASGLRNPFRFDVSDDGEVWTGDVGWNTWEEINRKSYSGLSQLRLAVLRGQRQAVGLRRREPGDLRDALRRRPEATAPYYAYHHNAKVVPGESCPTGSSSIAGMRFYRGSNFPLAYRDALFFADYSRDCIWAMRAGADGQPDPTRSRPSTPAPRTRSGSRSAPTAPSTTPTSTAVASAESSTRSATSRRRRSPMRTRATAPPRSRSTSTPPIPATPIPATRSAYAWDLDDDGDFDDSSSATPTHIYEAAGAYTPSVRVTDIRGASATATVSIDAGNSPPTPTIEAPTSDLRWAVGDEIAFSGFARDAEEGALPPERARLER